MTKQDVEKFLHDIKLDDYVTLFKENDIDGPMLVSMDEDELNDLGIANRFHQKKLIVKFKAYLKSLTQ